ncbi:hypothetical protein HDE_10998 [Halotydeus destructor]|nr:hypothetical protein HDE_10998 [Halotydeus destructor]
MIQLLMLVCLALIAPISCVNSGKFSWDDCHGDDYVCIGLPEHCIRSRTCEQFVRFKQNVPVTTGGRPVVMDIYVMRPSKAEARKELYVYLTVANDNALEQVDSVPERLPVMKMVLNQDGRGLDFQTIYREHGEIRNVTSQDTFQCDRVGEVHIGDVRFVHFRFTCSSVSSHKDYHVDFARNHVFITMFTVIDDPEEHVSEHVRSKATFSLSRVTTSHTPTRDSPSRSHTVTQDSPVIRVNQALPPTLRDDHTRRYDGEHTSTDGQWSTIASADDGFMIMILFIFLLVIIVAITILSMANRKPKGKHTNVRMSDLMSKR